MDQPLPLFRLFLVFSNKHYKFLQQIYVKNVHPVYGAGILTHDLWNVNLLPLPLDQGFRQTNILVTIRGYPVLPRNHSNEVLKSTEM